MANKYVVIADLRGGRNGTDPPLSLPDNQCVEAYNVDWYDGLLGRKRGGADAVGITGGTTWTASVATLIRHVPGSDETAAELWGVGSESTPVVKRLAGGSSFANVTLADPIATRPQDVEAASLNGKLFLAYDTTSTVNRLHCYDPSLASPQIRRVGLGNTSAPAVGNSSTAGTYAASQRYYKTDTIQLDATRVVRRSELSAGTSFTPSGTMNAAVVTHGTFPGEGETHWRVWGSPDNATFYKLSSDVGTSIATWNDTIVTTNYSQNSAAEPVGTFTVPTSAKHLISDGNRLLWAGSWESGKTSRVWYSPVLGSLDMGDDERTRDTAVQKDYVDLNENDGGYITGLGLLDASPYAFKYRQIYKLVPTGDVGAPYLPRRRSASIGCVAAKTIALAEDESGQASLYFLSHKGPYRIGVNGVQYLGRDNEDTWKTVNLGATNVVAHSIYHADIHQIWWYIATGSNNDPDIIMVFDTWRGQTNEQNQVRGGWSKFEGPATRARCSAMFSKTIGASMSRDLKPYVGLSSAVAIWMADSSTPNDAGTAYQAYVKTKPVTQGSPLGFNVGIGQASLIAKTSSSVITQTIDRDFGLETVTATVSLVATASESRVFRKIEGSDMAGAGVIQLQWGDSSAVSNQWTLDAIVAPIDSQERR